MLYACSDHADHAHDHSSMQGQMPSLARSNDNKLFMVYGHGDSILYSSLNDTNFSTPALVGLLPHLAASHSRGPQVAATSNGLAVIACNEAGDIFSYQMNGVGWSQGVKVNDVDTVAKEGLMSLAADGDNVYAVWLDLRSKNNQVYGARSADGGKTWSKNILVYASPDTTVCECCKPSVAVQGNNVYVMFRNWLDGNRDMYLIRSADGGNSFGNAEKLGKGSWALDGCPMDGGSLAVKSNGNVETVWRRENSVYTCVPGGEEKQIGEGKSCTIAVAGNKNVYAWTESGEVVVVLPDGKKEVLGKGKFPALKVIDNKRLICVWQQDKGIRHASLLIP